jgi:hypothetical protein
MSMDYALFISEVEMSASPFSFFWGISRFDSVSCSLFILFHNSLFFLNLARFSIHLKQYQGRWRFLPTEPLFSARERAKLAKP